MICVVQCTKIKMLKGKSFLITKSLAATRVGLLKEAQGTYGVRNVWTTDGRILYKENSRVFLYKKPSWHLPVQS